MDASVVIVIMMVIVSDNCADDVDCRDDGNGDGNDGDYDGDGNDGDYDGVGDGNDGGINK